MNDADVLRAAASVLEDLGLYPQLSRNELRAEADKIEQQAALRGDPVPCTAGLFTRKEAELARNGAASLVIDELGLGERDSDLLDLAGAVAAELIDQDPPGAVTLDGVIRARYSDSPAKVRSWWTAWS